MRRLIFCVLLLAGSSVAAPAARSDAVATFEEVTRLRSEGAYEDAVRILREFLQRSGPSDDALKRAHSELVFTLMQMDDTAGTEQAASRALRKFPDLTADTRTLPPVVNELYKRLRATLFGSLSVRTVPPDCHISISNYHEGPAPLSVEYMPVGHYRLTVSRAGYSEGTFTFETHPDRATFMEIGLDPHTEFWERGRIRPGLDLGLSWVALRYPDDEVFGTRVTADEPVVRFSFGVFVDIGIKQRLYFETGLRYVRYGNTALYRPPNSSLNFIDSGQIYQDYLSVPLMLKLFMRWPRNFYIAAGPEIGVLLRARFLGDYPGVWNEPNVDFSNELDGYNLSVNAGLGYEFGVRDHFSYIGFQSSFGLTETSKNGGDLQWRTLELKLSIGFIY